MRDTGFGGEGLLGVFCLLSFEKRILQYFAGIIPDIAVWSYTAAMLQTVTVVLFFAVGFYFQEEANCFFYQLGSSKESSCGKGVQLGGTIPVVTTETWSWQLGDGALEATKLWLWAAPAASSSFSLHWQGQSCFVFFNEHLPIWNSSLVTMKFGKPTDGLGLTNTHELAAAPGLLWSQKQQQSGL